MANVEVLIEPYVFIYVFLMLHNGDLLKGLEQIMMSGDIKEINTNISSLTDEYVQVHFR